MSDLPAILGGEPVRPQGEQPWPICDEPVRAAFEQLVQSGDWGQYLGPHCDALRQRLAELHAAGGQPASVRLCSGGTAAVWLALVGADIQPGDEVILAGYDFRANLGNIRSVGAVPVLVDVRADDVQLDVDQVAAAITPATRAIIASHLHGGSVRMRSLRQLADEHGLTLIEDICQNPLATVEGRTAGLWADVATLSFGGSKTLSAGRGGAVITGNDTIAARMLRFAERGNDVSPLSEMQAAVLLPQIESLPQRAAARRTFARRLADELQPFGLTALPPRTDAGCKPDYYKLGLLYDDAAWDGLPRQRLCDAMHAEGITLSPGFAALHASHAKRTFRAAGPLPNATAAGETVVGLHHPIMLTGEQGHRDILDAVTKLHAARCDLM